MKPANSVVVALFVLCNWCIAAEPAPWLKTESFDRDPGWDNSMNRVEASDPPMVTQDFGWSPGRIGGTIRRSITPAWYGMRLDRTLSFKDSFSASGKISVPTNPGEGTAYLGFFNHERQGWRPWSCMVMRLKLEKGRMLVFTDYMSSLWNAGAAEMELQLPADGSEHRWRFTYDPDATREPWSDTRLRDYLTTGRQTVDQILANANLKEPELTREGLVERLQAALQKGLVSYLARHRTEYWLRKQDKDELKGEVVVQIDDGPEFRSYLTADMREQPVAMDRFGIFNMQLAGAEANFHISDLTVNGKAVDLSRDPDWQGHGNRVRFADPDFVRQNFGYSSETKFAGGTKGEIGGLFYNVEPVNPLHGYYADDVGRLTLDDRIHFSGKLSFLEGSTDAGMFFGFFRAEDEKRILPPDRANKGGTGWPQPNALGVVVDGPARIGWYFMPVCTAVTPELSRGTPGRVFLPTRAHRTFTFDYDPGANSNVGRVTVGLDGEPPFTLDLTAEQRRAGATFDRFGLMSFRRGGKFSILYLDDLTYTTRSPGQRNRAPPRADDHDRAIPQMTRTRLVTRAGRWALGGVEPNG